MNLPSDIVFLIAGGESAANIDFEPLRKYGYLLGINDSAIHAPCHGAFTMDRLWIEARGQTCREKGLDLFVRHSVYDKYKELGTWATLYRVEVYFDRTTLQTVPFVCGGNNSGFAGFNFVCHYRPRLIFLFGFDFGGKAAHWYPQYPWSTKTNGNHYRKWRKDFEVACRTANQMGIGVYNCSGSPLEKVPKRTMEEVIEMCERHREMR